MSAVVVLLPADPESLAHPDGDDPDELHVTMVYLGKENLTPEQLDAAKQALTIVGDEGAPILADISGAGILGSDAAIVLFLQAEDLIVARQVIEAALATADLGTPLDDKFPGFTPHLTIGYPDEDIERGEMLLHHALPMAGGTITLDRLAIMNGDDLHTIQLGSGTESNGETIETDATTDEMAVVAAVGGPEVETAPVETPEGAAEPAAIVDDAAAPTGQTHAGLIIKAADSGRVLMTQRTPYHNDDEQTSGAWEFPGGSLDPGEDALEGALREFAEETGLKLPDYEIRDECSNEIYRGFIAIVPNEAWTADASMDPLETMGIGWFALDDIPGLARPEVADTIDADKILAASTFANPWHDLLGRFAPAGSGGTSDFPWQRPVARSPVEARPGGTGQGGASMESTPETLTETVDKLWKEIPEDDEAPRLWSFHQSFEHQVDDRFYDVTVTGLVSDAKTFTYPPSDGEPGGSSTEEPSWEATVWVRGVGDVGSPVTTSSSGDEARREAAEWISAEVARLTEDDDALTASAVNHSPRQWRAWFAVPAPPAPAPAPAAAPAAAPAKPPIVLVGLAVDGTEVPHGGRGLPYMSDIPYVALGEVRLGKEHTPDMVTQVVDSLAPIPAQANVKSSLTRSDPLSRAVLMEPTGLVDAYTALKTAVETSGLKFEDYPFAVQLGNAVTPAEVKALTGQPIKFGSLIAVMPDGTVINSAQQAPTQATPEEEAPMEDTQELSNAQRLRLAADQRRAQVTSAGYRFRVAATAGRVVLASEFPPIAEGSEVAEPVEDAGESIDIWLVGPDGAEFGPIGTATGSADAANEWLASVTIAIEDPSAVAVDGIIGALQEAGIEAELHDDMSGSDVQPGTYTVVAKGSSAEAPVEDEGGAPRTAAPEFAADTVIEIDPKTRHAQWEGPLVVEGIKSGDGRQIDLGALTWRNLPLPLMMMTKNPVGGDGHDGAELAGRIDWIERRDNGEIWGGGILDIGSQAGSEALRLLTPDEHGFAMLRGVSVDLDDVEMYFEGDDFADGGGTPTMAVSKARVMGATLCPFPAFQEAQVVLVSDALAAALSGESCDCDNEVTLVASAGLAMPGAQARTFLPIPWETPTLVASASGAVIPVKPPADWFELPPLDQIADEAVRFTSDGRVYGLCADDKSCHIGFADRCVRTPKSKTNYRYFANKQTETAEGFMIPTGTIIMDTVHPNLRMQASDAQAFYAHTGCAVADVVAYDTPKGVYLAGALRPTATPEQIRALRGSDISPDWRNIRGNLECVALLAVNTSGFITPALAASGADAIELGETEFVVPGKVAAAVSFETNEVLALVAAGMKHHARRKVISASTEDAELRAEFAAFKAAVQPLIDADLSRRRAAAAARMRAPRNRELDARKASARNRFERVPQA